MNFAVFSAHADADDALPVSRRRGARPAIDLPERDGDVWHGHVVGHGPGQLYGYRAHGPYRPDEGHRFNPHKLLIDPYARRSPAIRDWHDALMGYDVGAAQADLSFDTRDSAPRMPKCVVEDPAVPLGPTAPPTRRCAKR